jgi:hypothetical protein
MLTRTAYGLAIVLASVYGAPAAPRAPATADTQNVYNPSNAGTVGSRARSESAPTVWGWPYMPPASNSRQ